MKNKKLSFFFLLLIVSISLLLLGIFELEPDYFWHIKAGEYMYKNGPLTNDIFSWSVVSKYWMSHEWLFEIILFAFKNIFGKIHTIVYCFICILSLLLFLYYSNRDNILKNIPFTIIYFIFLTSLYIFFIQARPHMLSYIFISFTIYFLYDLYKNKDSKKIYFLPLITVLWSNIHGGCSNLSYLFCFLFFVGGLFSFKFKKFEAKRLSKKQLIKYLIIMFLCMISVCINIHGVKMFIYPYENMMDSTMINNIREWRSTSFDNIFNYIYLLFIVYIFFVFLISDKKIELIDLLLFGLSVYLGIKSVRFWIYTPIIMNYVIFDYVKSRKIDKGTYFILSCVSLIFIIIFAYNFNNIVNVEYKLSIDKELVDIIKKENPQRLYNYYDYGGELVYNDIPVFIDGRADLYSKYNYKDYLKITSLKGDYIKLIKKYDFDYFLVDKSSSLYFYLKYNDDCEDIYSNDELVLYKKIVN